MTDHGKSANPEAEFATLLDAYSPSDRKDMQVGDKVRGKIISISNDTIFVDIGNKIDGVVETAEMLDQNQQMPYKEGDTVELYVVELREDEIRLSKALSGAGSFDLLREAHQNAVPVDGKILETCKGGLRVEVMGRKAFCPASQIDIKPLTRLLNGTSDLEYLQPIRIGDVISVTARLIRLRQVAGKEGTTLFMFTEVSWTNQRGEVAVRGKNTYIKY